MNDGLLWSDPPKLLLPITVIIVMMLLFNPPAPWPQCMLSCQPPLITITYCYLDSTHGAGKPASELPVPAPWVVILAFPMAEHLQSTCHEQHERCRCLPLPQAQRGEVLAAAGLDGHPAAEQDAMDGVGSRPRESAPGCRGSPGVLNHSPHGWSAPTRLTGPLLIPTNPP